ncbi:endonuclease 8-like 1 isoform X11 [Pan paniscus]|uniref:endonuclease 8-like 1 isoform X11 n=1 Tax=Pan paniscus TaxID=9597 RepID=UPI0024368585|nr:endonuclease 8-like 1 isoform X5 [Pan paniscus]
MGRTGPRAPLLPKTRIWRLTFSRKTSPVGARPGAAPRCGGGKVRASAVAKCPLPLKAHLRLRFRTARGQRQVAKQGGRRTLPPSLRMPEGPELHLASQFVNEACRALVFGGCVEKSSVSRNPEVPFESSAYRISASARGKELRLILSPLPGAQPPQEPLALVFRFGMSGSFQLVPREELPRHAHLRFYTAPPGRRLALCFVDIRRFGRWDLGGKWQPGRGPCVLQEYQQFRTLCLQARPLPGHEGQRETFLRGLQPSGLRGPASSRTQKLPQCPRRGGGRGDRQPLATADPGRSRLTSHPWNQRGPQPLSRRLSLLALTLSYCLALHLGV